MKKLYAVLFLSFMFFSCSESDDFNQKENISRKPTKPITALDPTKLARVIFYPGTNQERHWYFYPNGLLRRIVLTNGTIIQNFTYDHNNNLIQTQFFGDPFLSLESPNTKNFTYDTNNRINSVNGNPINYDPITNSYLLETYTRTLNSDYILTSESYLGSYDEKDKNGNPITIYINVYGMYYGYNNNNQTSSINNNNPSGSYYQHDSKINPFKTALLPICRALPITKDFGYYFFWASSDYNSQNNITKRFYEIEDPESDRFEYTYNANDLPISRTRKSYYFNTLESTSLDILYYYQGDVIPN